MTDQIPAEFLGAMADLTTHVIEGTTREGNKHFKCPLVTHVESNLWQGGTPADSPHGEVPSYFKYVLNLYPWERYTVPEGTEVRTEQLYDAQNIESAGLLYELAEWVNEKRALGPTLVHCQAGINRSALVSAYALILAGRTPDEAISLLRAQRSPTVLSNETFEGFLRSLPAGGPR